MSLYQKKRSFSLTYIEFNFKNKVGYERPERVNPDFVITTNAGTDILRAVFNKRQYFSSVQVNFILFILKV